MIGSPGQDTRTYSPVQSPAPPPPPPPLRLVFSDKFNQWQPFLGVGCIFLFFLVVGNQRMLLLLLMSLYLFLITTGEFSLSLSPLSNS